MMYTHQATQCARRGQSDKDIKIVYWSVESADLGFDWRDRKKQNFISYSNVSRVRIYGKLPLKTWHKAINTILDYYQLAHQSKKSGVEILPLPKTFNAGP